MTFLIINVRKVSTSIALHVISKETKIQAITALTVNSYRLNTFNRRHSRKITPETRLKLFLVMINHLFPLFIVSYHYKK